MNFHVLPDRPYRQASDGKTAVRAELDDGLNTHTSPNRLPMQNLSLTDDANKIREYYDGESIVNY